MSGIPPDRAILSTPLGLEETVVLAPKDGGPIDRLDEPARTLELDEAPCPSGESQQICCNAHGSE